MLAGLTLAGASAADPADRLDRFRELAASQLGLAQLLESEPPADAYREIYALLDDEIVESLGSGGVFASLEFLQDRLDAFAEVWGGASLRLARAGGLLVGTFVLDERSDANSVRVYGSLRGEPALLTVLYRAGRPSLSLLPAARETTAFVVAWEGAPSGWGSRPLRLEVLRRDGDRVRVTWSSADLFTEGLLARSWSVRGADLRVRYELRYPGWAPGCDGQTEQEDVYRVGSTGVVSRVSRQEHNAWHRELGAGGGPPRVGAGHPGRGDADRARAGPGAPQPAARRPGLRPRLRRAGQRRRRCGVGGGRRRPPSVDPDLPPAGRPVAADRRGPGATMTLPNA